MLKKVIDISVPLQSDMPVWPGSVGLQLAPLNSIKMGHSSNGSQLHCDVHMGTHVDAPWHFVEDGTTIEQLSLDTLIGRAMVAYLPKVEVITKADLSNLRLPSDTKRLLLRTQNSELWKAEVKEFKEDFVALTADAAQWIVDYGINLIGVDYLSVQRYGDSPRTHQILLKAGIVILEGLNLADIEPGAYELICLPICLVGAEGAPARAVLRVDDSCV